MSKADELRAKAERLNRQKAPAPEVPAISTPAGPVKKVVRSADIRVTVDLAPTQHRALQTWAADTAETLGRARVTKQDILTALVRRLLADPALAAQITSDLADTK